MSIEQFLNDLDKKSQEHAKKLKGIEDAIRKKEVEEKEFLVRFSSIYAERIVKDFNEISTKLKEKFIVDYDRITREQQPDVKEGKIDISPKFESEIKILTIVITAEANRRLITITGKAFDQNPKGIQESIVTFQDTLDKFFEIYIEDEISKILAKYFIH
jgi:hypothetical protein